MPRSTRRRPTRPVVVSARKPITAQDLMRFVLVSDPQISPGGSHIVFVRKHTDVVKNEYVTNLWVAAVPSRGGAEPTPTQFTSGNKDAHPRFSHDGSRIAFISTRDKTKPQLYVISAPGASGNAAFDTGVGGEARALTSFPEGSIGAFKWSPNGRFLAVSFREQDQQWTEDAKKKRKDANASDPPRVLDDWWYRLDGDGYFNAQRYHLLIVDTATGKHRAVYTRDTLGDFSFDFSHDSSRLIVATNRHPKALVRADTFELLVINLKTGRTTPIPNLPAGPKSHPAWSPNGTMIAYAGRKGGKDGLYDTENIELFVCDVRTGGTRSLTAGTDICLMAAALSDLAEVDFAPRLCWSHDSRRVFFRLGMHGCSHVASVPARGGKVVVHTRGQAMINFTNGSADGRFMPLTITTPASPPDVAVGIMRGSTLAITRLTHFNATLLRERQIAPVESLWVRTPDGTRVQTWVMKPPQFKRGRKYPAVLEVHGGPHAQYGVGFFHEFQMLAAQGNVVVFSNPRGSKGYGRDHCAAIRGNWGGPDWIDVQAVTRFIQSLRFVNPKRIGIMGGSYGGYMTNWAIGHSRDYKAAISDRCVSNLVSMAGNSDFVDAPDIYWPGNFWNKPEARWSQSPIKYMGDCRTPTLIIHSEGDLRCNVEQSEQVFSCLKLNNVPCRFVRYPSTTSHGMSRSGPPDLRLHRLDQILGWWKKWL